MAPSDSASATAAFLLAVGQRVAALRGHGRLSQEQLAEAADINVQTLSRLERGVGAVRIDTLAAVAGALETTPADVLAGLELTPAGPGGALESDPHGRELARSWERLSPARRRLLTEMAAALGGPAGGD